MIPGDCPQSCTKGTSMIEVEIKLPLKDIHETEHTLSRLGFQFYKVFQQIDTYFDNDQSQIRTEGKALRIRDVINMTAGLKNSVLTFKGQKLDTVSMTRPEFETELTDSETMFNILQGLGYHPVAPLVNKTRKEYALRTDMGTLHACLDQVENLGDFLELEIMVSDEEAFSREDCLEVMGRILDELGYSLANTVTNSYLSMLQGVQDV